MISHMITLELMRVTGLERGLIVQNIIVLKCGGSSMDELSDDFFENIASLKKAGLKPVIVHGGGPAIKKMLEKLNIEFEFVDGLRKTTEEMMDIVEMVLSGYVNPALTRRVNETELSAIGLSGANGNILIATPINYDRYGLVGEICRVNISVIETLLSLDFVPVISPVAVGKDGNVYNINADTAAGAIAKALNAKQLIFVTDVPGIMKNGELLEVVTTKEVEEFIEDGTIYGGMIPKVKAAINGLSGRVDEVMIVNGKESVINGSEQLVGTVLKQESGVVKL